MRDKDVPFWGPTGQMIHELGRPFMQLALYARAMPRMQYKAALVDINELRGTASNEPSFDPSRPTDAPVSYSR